MKFLAGLLFAASLLALTDTAVRAAPFADPMMQDWMPIDYGGSWYYSSATGHCRLYAWGGFIAYALC